MIFWILLALVAIAVVVAFIGGVLEDGIGWAFGSAFFALIIGAVVSGFVIGIASIWITPTYQHKGEAEHELTALQTSSSIEGRSFFLGSGYINGKRTLNYITNSDGAYRMESADADQSVVYQGPDSPTVTVHEWDMENGWLLPWSFGHNHTYTFHIPEGSILSDYEITNE